MARVVQRRTNPPYLLIIFVFLFLIAATFAVMSYVNLDKEVKAHQADKETLSKLAGANDENEVKQLQDIGSKTKPPLTVFAQMRAQRNDLADAIIGTPDYAAAAVAVGKKISAATTQGSDVENISKLAGQEGSPLVQIIKGKLDEIKANQATIATYRTDLAAAQTQIKSLLKAQDEDKKNHDAAIADLNKKVLGLQTDIDKANEDAKTQVATLRAEIEKDNAANLKTVEAKGKEIEKLTADNTKLKDDITKLKVKIVDKSAPQVALHPDGKVVKVVEAAKICYIDLGNGTKVTPGLTFAVYPSTGITEKPKARIKVNNVLAATSECVVVEEDNRDPITQGDLISNVAYGTNRTYLFLVEGLFDLRGSGQATMTGAEAVKEMIAKAGGKITNSLSSDVDYVVLGEPPVLPAEPKEGDQLTDSEKKLRADQKAAYKLYQDILTQANTMRIPILNTNRFLDTVGFSTATK